MSLRTQFSVTSTTPHPIFDQLSSPNANASGTHGMRTVIPSGPERGLEGRYFRKRRSWLTLTQWDCWCASLFGRTEVEGGKDGVDINCSQIGRTVKMRRSVRVRE